MLFPRWDGLANSPCHRDELLQPLVLNLPLGPLPLVTQLIGSQKDILKNGQEQASLKLNVHALIAKSHWFQHGKPRSWLTENAQFLCVSRL